MIRRFLVALGLAALLAASPSFGSSELFSGDAVLPLTLEAPLGELFATARDDTSYTVDGTLRVDEGGEPVPVRVALRGHTSLRDTECAFPKLKLELKQPAPGGSLLAGIKTLKIGTHCGDSDAGKLTPKYGRVANERSPLREVVAYRLLDAVGVPTLRTRPARITYIDTGAGTAGDRLTRNALLLEDDRDALDRLGASGEIDAKAFTTAADLFEVDDSVNLAFGEALIGNFDWCVLFTRDDTYRCDAKMKLWNVIAARTESGKARPIMYDFDVSGIVTGRHLWFEDVYNASFVASGSQHEVEVISQLQRTRTLFTRAVLDAARRRFTDRRDAAYRVLDSAPLDDDGRRIARDYLETFFREIGSDDAFYRPVVVKPGQMVFAAADGDAPVCGNAGAVPVGTPVAATDRTDGGRVEVRLLDALWHWAPPVRCPQVKRGAVWMDPSAIGRDFPASGTRHD